MVRKTIVCLLVLAAARPAPAHPIDEQVVRTDARFAVGRKSVSFEIKLPLAPLGERDAAAYVAERLLAFDGRDPLTVVATTASYEQNPMSAAPARFAVVSGRFDGAVPIRDLYIFDNLFTESGAPHVGDAVIERGDRRYDFQFKPGQYFHLDLTKK